MMADLRDIVLKVASRSAANQFGLGKAFQDIAEPIQFIDRPVNDAVEYVGNQLADQTNLVPVQARTPTTQYAENIRRQGLNEALQMATPTPSSLLIGKAMPLMKAAKGSQIAERMVTGDALEAGKAAIKNNPAFNKTAADLYREAKAAYKGVVVVPSAADKVAEKMNWGTVTVKP